MHSALVALLDDVLRYTIIIKRARINWDTGQLQDTDLVIREADGFESGASPSPDMLRSRKVLIHLELNDNGVAFINLTQRHWFKRAHSQDLGDRMLSFNRSLLQGARTKWLTPVGSVFIGLLPLLCIIVELVAYNIFTPNIKKDSTGAVLYPDWISIIFWILLISWPFAIIAGLVILWIRVRAGGLRVWPESLTMRSFADTLFKIRTTIAVPENINKVLMIALTALASGAVGWLLKS
jgi:hypothetical protein